MPNTTCVAFMLFCVYRHYKRLDLSIHRKNLISDMILCKKLLRAMLTNHQSHNSVKLTVKLTTRTHELGINTNLALPLRYVDYYDKDVISLMLTLTNEIITIAKNPLKTHYEPEIFKRLLVLHNLPRVLVDNSSCDSSVTNTFHISKQTAMDTIFGHTNYIF